MIRIHPLLIALLALTTAAHAQPRRFAFSPQPNHETLQPTTLYTPERGYGFESPANVQLKSNACTADSPFLLSIKLPEGNYRVTLTLGHPDTPSTTTVKAELRRLMLERIHTSPGQSITRSFVVNLRTPAIPPNGQVRLNSRETSTEAAAWDDKLTLEFAGQHPSVSSIEIEKIDLPTLFILGDSTVCDQPAEPYASWGQMLPRFLKPQIAVANHAESGESLAHSTSARRLDKVLSLMKKGDYLLIQFGHNDMKSKAPSALDLYKQTLRQWVQQTKQHNATPILITSVNRHSFQGNTIINSLKDYPQTVRQVAKEENVPLIDLQAMSKTFYEALGPTESIKAFKHDPDLANFDHTHHSPYGAYELARCIIEGLRQSNLPLTQQIAEDAAPFDPAHPDSPTDFLLPPSPTFNPQKPLGD